MTVQSLSMMDFDKLDGKLSREEQHLGEYCDNHYENNINSLVNEYSEKYLSRKIDEIVEHVHKYHNDNEFYFSFVPNYSRFWFHKIGESGVIIVAASIIFGILFFIAGLDFLINHGFASISHDLVFLSSLLGFVFTEEWLRNYYFKCKLFNKKYGIAYKNLLDLIKNKVDLHVLEYRKDEAKFMLVRDIDKMPKMEY